MALSRASLKRTFVGIGRHQGEGLVEPQSKDGSTGLQLDAVGLGQSWEPGEEQERSRGEEQRGGAGGGARQRGRAEREGQRGRNVKEQV